MWKIITNMLYPADPNGEFTVMVGNTERYLIDVLTKRVNSTKPGNAKRRTLLAAISNAMGRWTLKDYLKGNCKIERSEIDEDDKNEEERSSDVLESEEGTSEENMSSETWTIVIKNMNVRNGQVTGLTFVKQRILPRGTHFVTWISGTTIVETTLIMIDTSHGRRDER